MINTNPFHCFFVWSFQYLNSFSIEEKLRRGSQFWTDFKKRFCNVALPAEINWDRLEFYIDGIKKITKTSINSIFLFNHNLGPNQVWICYDSSFIHWSEFEYAEFFQA